MHLSLPQEKRSDSLYAAAEVAIGACVHCGFCNATCPTYKLLGDERDGPRGRIYAIKDMLEQDTGPPVDLVPHLDRCLSCLSCRTTCPSGVDYARLIDLARGEIAGRRRRSLDGILRGVLAVVMTSPYLLRLGVIAGRLAARLPLPALLRAATDVARQANPARGATEGDVRLPPLIVRKARVAVLVGCAQRAVASEINDATVRLLRRLGCEVEIVGSAACCGSLDHHLGHAARAHRLACQTVDVLAAAHRALPFDHIVSNITGCGAHLKDLPFQLPGNRDAEVVAGLVRDVAEVVNDLGFAIDATQDVTVAYHAACTLQHGQRIVDLPAELLERAGFAVVSPKEAHMCCGSAGTYNILQPAIAGELGARKAANLLRRSPAVIASGNVGCILQLRRYADVPVVHTVELLDWAAGGRPPLALAGGDVGHA